MSGLTLMSNQDLESNLKSLVRKERMLLHLILEHIREIDSRKIYLDRAHSSMFHYMMNELGYSSSAAMRRLDAARMLNSVPSLADKIQQGDVNLTQVGELSRAIKEKEKSGFKVSDEVKNQILDQISGLNSEQTQKVVALSLDVDLKEPEKVRVQKDDSVHLSITLTRQQYELLTSCKDKASHSLQLAYGDFSWAKVIEVVAGQYLDSKLFESKSTKCANSISLVDDCRADQAMSKNKTLSSSPSTNVKSKVQRSEIVAESINADNKTLTLKTRRYILNRDKCCQYKDKRTGRQCRSTYGLQVDHIVPRWSGGSHAPENLQVLCGTHNNHKYRSEAGIKLRRAVR
ncbi:HNH endonuclease [Bdellovibrio sp. HCB185ZH]|uniref:HNH endonuclease n=1 Tax=Bdellovibrio sp. HCB185ZH TaxID=3394235 RepID=UPI0039A4738E